MKRSAREVLPLPKARFIGRSPASFFMHRRCASFQIRVAPPANEKSNPIGLLRSLRRVDKKDADRILLLDFKIQTISTNRYKQCSVRAEISRSFQIAYNNSITFFRKCAKFSEATGICFIRSFIVLSVRFIN